MRRHSLPITSTRNIHRLPTRSSTQANKSLVTTFFFHMRMRWRKEKSVLSDVVQFASDNRSIFFSLSLFCLGLYIHHNLAEFFPFVLVRFSPPRVSYVSSLEQSCTSLTLCTNTYIQYFFRLHRSRHLCRDFILVAQKSPNKCVMRGKQFISIDRR